MKLIVQLGYSGFGDRIRVLCSCIYYANKLNAKVLPIWNDIHWREDFNDSFVLNEKFIWNGNISGSVYPEDILDINPYSNNMSWEKRKSLIYDKTTPLDKQEIDIFYLSRYLMKPISYEEGLRNIAPTERIKNKFNEIRHLLPHDYTCIHIRDTDKKDNTWEDKIQHFKNNYKNGVVITDSYEVKSRALELDLVCLSDIPKIIPLKGGVHHMKDDVLEKESFTKRRVNDGLLMDIIIAGLAKEFIPFKITDFIKNEPLPPEKKSHATSRFSDFIEAGRLYNWFNIHFNGD